MYSRHENRIMRTGLPPSNEGGRRARSQVRVRVRMRMRRQRANDGVCQLEAQSRGAGASGGWFGGRERRWCLLLPGGGDGSVYVEVCRWV